MRYWMASQISPSTVSRSSKRTTTLEPTRCARPAISWPLRRATTVSHNSCVPLVELKSSPPLVPLPQREAAVEKMVGRGEAKMAANRQVGKHGMAAVDEH